MRMNNTEMLKLAESYLGKGGATFRSYCGLGKKDPWCNAYVSYIFHKSGNALLYCNGKKQTYCPTSIKWCYNNLAVIPPYLAMPMDVIYFDWELNGVPNHIGFVRGRKSADAVYTIEGNTNGGIVAKKTRNAKYVQAIFRPHYVGKYDISKPLVIDGQFGYSSVAMLQQVLGLKVTGILDIPTVKMLQKTAGVTQDGSWGTKTSKAVQKMVGVKADGYFGVESVKALQAWINKYRKSGYKGVYPVAGTTKTTTNYRSNMAKTANSLAYTTNTSKAKYPKGKPTEAYKKALAKLPMTLHRWKPWAKVGASCDVYVWTVVRTAGIDSKFPSGLWKQLSYMEKHLIKVKTSEAKAGDIGFYRKNVKGKHGHIFIVYDGNQIKEASAKSYYPKTTKSRKSRLSVLGKKYVYVFRFRDKTVTTGTLKLGASGENVKRLQEYLNWYGNNLKVDGDFGTATEKALKKFQTEQGLTADGVCGDKTIAKMKAVVK